MVINSLIYNYMALKCSNIIKTTAHYGNINSRKNNTLSDIWSRLIQRCIIINNSSSGGQCVCKRAIQMVQCISEVVFRPIGNKNETFPINRFAISWMEMLENVSKYWRMLWNSIRNTHFQALLSITAWIFSAQFIRSKFLLICFV